ncbi:hypothetical protein [Streptomyces chrestomyceticus]|uniref:hypothetical protein n=1 Tax=Streptomyces chrestomyceticus TaxID=68185 RepID=UPI003795222C
MISARIEIDYDVEAGEDAAEFGFVKARNNFLAASTSLRRITLPAGGSFTLILEDIPMSSLEGLARLKIREKARCDEGNLYMHQRSVAFRLPKSTPKIPRNFHPDTSLVDTGGTVKLRWDGPDNLDYWIQLPDGQEVHVGNAAPGPGVSQRSYEWEVSPTPQRGTTYTLVGRAANSSGQPDQGYFLTTTVHARIPEFESGTRTPWIEGSGNKSRVTFSPTGVDITSDGGWGSVTAGEGVFENALRTKRARGLDNDDGWIEFPADGIRAGHGEGSDLGTVTAEKVSATGVNTQWVQGRDAGDGWITFPQSGVHVYKDGKREWGTVAAAKADLNDLVTVRAEVRERLTLQGGLTVVGVLETQDGPPRLAVHGRLDAEGDLNAVGNVVAGGGLTVNGESLFAGKVNANGALSVRNGGSWLLHVNEDKVAVQGNLRVHGAFRSDS